ncbi:MAG: hypothetical protein ACJ746_24395 [Bryobacteraceae bacterium]
MSKAFPLAAGLACLYLCFLTASHYWDGVLFSLYIEKVAERALPRATLYHPNHLLYSAIGCAAYQLLHWIGLRVRSITVLQFINVFASVLCSAIVFRLCKHLFRSPELAVPCTLLFALGATWWRFSTDADSYILSVLFLTAAISLVLACRSRIVLAGICLSLAMLIHELAIFGYVPILVAIWRERISPEARLRRIPAFVAGTGAFVTGAYYIAYLATHSQPSATSFLTWITSISHDTKTTQSLAQLFVSNASSYIKLFGGGKLSLVRDFFSPAVAVALLFSTICVIAVIATALRQKTAPEFPSSITDRRARVVLWSWIAVYVVFLSWFEPGNAFYKLFIWPAIVLLIGSYLDRRGKVFTPAFKWFTLGIASWNFAAFIYPHSHVQADPVLSLAMRIDKELPKSATVYYKSLSPDDWYLEYFAPGRKWKPLPPMSEIRQGSTTAPVCFETTALPYVQGETDLALRWNLVNSQHNVRLECVKPKTN